MSRYIENTELDNWFGYHQPSSPVIADGHDFVRRESRELAGVLNQLLPECAEKTLALRKIREAAMWANAAIACKQEIGERPPSGEDVEDLLYTAWTVIANAGDTTGGWAAQSQTWQDAAARWRDRWHAWTDARKAGKRDDGNTV